MSTLENDHAEESMSTPEVLVCLIRSHIELRRVLRYTALKPVIPSSNRSELSVMYNDLERIIEGIERLCAAPPLQARSGRDGMC